jgi:protein KTI12
VCICCCHPAAPLIPIKGYPSAGKTTRATQLKEFCESKIANASADARVSRLKVHLINDQTLGVARSVYHTAKAEKDARAEEYSAVKRVLSRDDIVIADGLNYIKGFRYQLYCEAKAVQTPNCVVSLFYACVVLPPRLTVLELHIGTPADRCRENNKKLLADKDSGGGYEEEDFENLIFRYEEPNGMTRWDSPLFIVVEEDETPPCEQIWEAMVGSDGKTKVVKPNMATVLVCISVSSQHNH